jgi:hypothetical protein
LLLPVSVFSLVWKLVGLSVSGSGEVMDFVSLFSHFGLGVGGGFILYVIFSLLGYGIHKAFRLTKL